MWMADMGLPAPDKDTAKEIVDRVKAAALAKGKDLTVEEFREILNALGI